MRIKTLYTKEDLLDLINEWNERQDEYFSDEKISNFDQGLSLGYLIASQELEVMLHNLEA